MRCYDIALSQPIYRDPNGSANATTGGICRIRGAHVNCWIDAPSKADAVAQAEREVRAAAWIPETVDSVRSVTSMDYAGDIAGREYFEQAIIDGVAIVFHTWPPGSNAHSDLH